MKIGSKDLWKLAGISIVIACAIFVCNLFLSYRVDIIQIENLITTDEGRLLYNAQSTMANVICAISGGCLIGTSVVLLFFYIKQYVDSHSKELGIMKALGYSRIKIAFGFWKFGLSVFIGAVIGYAGSFIIMDGFYESMNEDHLLPDISVHINLVLAVILILVPTICFCGLAIIYAHRKLKRPALDLLREQQTTKLRKMKAKKKTGKKDTSLDFLHEVRRSNVKGHPALIFFVAFGVFCYSDMVQMSFYMKEVASEMFGVMIFLIGIVLAATSLILAITTIVNSNAKNIAMMKVYGYTAAECTGAVLNGYRIVTYIGFVIGSIYQFVLMKLMMGVFTDDNLIEIPEVTFQWGDFFITLGSFLIVYELLIYIFSRKIANVSVKKIMLE